jgi:hypothetical protein
MKTLPLNQLKLALVCALLLILQSCNGPAVPGSWKNDKISSGKRDDFHKLNDGVLIYLKANDPKGLKAYLSKEMIAKNIERQVELMSNRLTDNDYELLDEYYVVHKQKDTDTVATTTGDINRYRVIYPYDAKEMYLAFFVPKKADNKYLISLVYANFDYGWKLVKMDLGPYTINGKTAPEYYKMARDRYDKKQLEAATSDAALATFCFKPSSFWQYPDEPEATKFYIKVRTEADNEIRFPIVLHQIATGPMILRLYDGNTSDGAYPMIYYMTHFDLKDTSEVKKENIQVRKVIDKMMPGLLEDNKFILYSAFNTQPNGHIAVDHFDMKVQGK